MKLQMIVALIALGVAMSGCATIIDGTTEPISVSTTPEQGAQCTLTNSEGTWYVTTPGSAVVHKTKNDMSVDCTKAGYQPGHMVAVSHFGGATFGNIVAGGIIGAGVDAASGANYYYDSPLMVPLGQRTNGAPVTSSQETMSKIATAAGGQSVQGRQLTQVECASLKATGVTPEQFAKSGCCSWHGGVCGCSNGRTLCCDNSLSPSCTCNSHSKQLDHADEAPSG